MEYRILGKTGLNVSVVGFGGIPVQRVDDKATEIVIRRAEELGINFIDTARGYTVSEEYIGKALKNRRDKWIIATKTMVRDYEGMKKDIEISLKNLQTDYIDLYQCHNIKSQEEYEKVLSENGSYKALLEAKKKGIIGHIGVTSHSLDMLKIMVEEGKFETIMYPYNIIEMQGYDLFKRAAQLNIGVIAMKPMAGGNIENGDMALKFILENKDITCAVPGMASIAEVEQNAAVGNDFKPLTYEEREEALDIANKLGSDFCRRCGYCAPCPQGIDIVSCNLFLNYIKRYDLAEWAKERYFSMTKRAKDCKECGICETRCPYNLQIREKLKEVRQWFEE